jgi:purine-nucleoside phosphorylase
MPESSALERLRALAPAARPRVAVVLGSGWGGLTGQLQDALRIPYADLPGFPQATVAGHAGELWLGRIGTVEVAVMSGRKHGYETGAVDGMKLPLRCLQALGCEVLVQTNAAGSLHADWGPGSLMLVADHINLPQRSPLVGEAGSERFVGMADAYDRVLRLGARQVALRMGLRVLALSLITNLAAGLSDEALSHALTLSAAQAASERAGAFLGEVIRSLALDNTPHA